MKEKSFFSRLFGGGAPTQEVVQPEIITAPKEVAVAIKPTSKLYTAEDVHRDLTAFVLLFLSDIQQEIERKNVPMAVSREASLLQKLGFNRSKNAKLVNQIKSDVEAHNKAYEEKKAALAFMQKAWATFGKDTMVVRYDKFFELLRKYNLVCGSFDHYTGTIPADNLADIERVVNILENNTELVIPFRYITEVDTDDNDITMLQWFNLCPMSAEMRKTLLSSMGLTNFEVGRVRPKASGYRLSGFDRLMEHEMAILSRQLQRKLSVSDKSPKMSQYYANLSTEDCLTFIAAPAQEMENFKIELYSSREIRQRQAGEAEARRRQVEAEERRMREIRTYDPFICSLTPFGVMVYTKWGDEAQDEIIKRYEQLRDAIIGKGGAR